MSIGGKTGPKAVGRLRVPHHCEFLGYKQWENIHAVEIKFVTSSCTSPSLKSIWGFIFLFALINFSFPIWGNTDVITAGYVGTVGNILHSEKTAD